MSLLKRRILLRRVVVLYYSFLLTPRRFLDLNGDNALRLFFLWWARITMVVLSNTWQS